jgi:hypothetical protein
MEEWKYISNILDFGTSRRCVVSLTLQPIYPQVKTPRHTLDRMLLYNVEHEITKGVL